MTKKFCLIGILGCGFGFTGCHVEAETLSKFVTDPDPLRSVAWEPGTDVTEISIDGVYGDIAVKKGKDGQVGVVFEPFDYRGASEEAEAQKELKNNLTREIEEKPGVIKVWTARKGHDGLGAAISVFLPPDFDGKLTVHNRGSGSINPGDVAVDYVAQGSALTLNNDSLGDCGVKSTGTLTYTKVVCDGDTQVDAVSNVVDISVTGLNHSASVGIAAIASPDSDLLADSRIVTEQGDIDVRFPTGPDFAVQAQAKAGTVEEGTLPDACSVAEASPASKTVSCGTGAPVFKVTSGEGDVTLRYK